MKIILTSVPEVLIVEPEVFADERGFFMETYHRKRYARAGIKGVFVQDNISHSVKGTLRGLHYQWPHAQAKMVQVIRGEILDVAVDIRRGSPTFGRWVSVKLSDKKMSQLYIPEGFAHGFCVLSDTADVNYKCTNFYAPDDEGGILWSDPALDIDWPMTDPLLSTKDSQFPCLHEVSPRHLPVYEDRT